MTFRKLRMQADVMLLTLALLTSGCGHSLSTGEVLTYTGVGGTLMGAGVLTQAYAGHGNDGATPVVGWSLLAVGMTLAVVGVLTTRPDDAATAAAKVKARAEHHAMVRCAGAMPPSPCQQPPR